MQALARLVAALKPRGWLVIEDFDGRVIDRTIPMLDAAAAALFKRVGGALVTLMEERGFEVEWARRLYGRLKAAGLTEVGMEGHVAVSEGGSLGASLDAANFAQVRREAVAKGLVTDAEIDAVLARLNAPDFALFSLVMFTAWGRRPDLAILIACGRNFTSGRQIMIDRANEQVVAAPIRWPIGDVLDKAKSAWARIADVLTVYAEAWGAALALRGAVQALRRRAGAPRHASRRAAPPRL